MAKKLNEIKPATYSELEKLNPEEMGITLKKSKLDKIQNIHCQFNQFFSFIGKWIENS